MPTELLQIVPMLPPAISGVGDYAVLLARELATHCDIRTHFLNSDPTWRDGEESIAPFPATILQDRSARAMTEALGNAGTGRAALLHYVGYGYARRGCPFWLVHALEIWKRRTGGRLIVLFHEISGTGPIWTSGFWTSGLQDWLAKRLARLADFRRVTTGYGANRLCAMLPVRAPVKTLAVFSTLGEPAALVPYGERQRQMIVFGGGGWRREAYTRHLPALVEACRCLRIERVIDVGVPVGLRPALPVPFVELGVLAAEEASDLLNHSTAGFFTYLIPHIGKSTIFAAYCAHGLTPVTFADNLENGDDHLQPNVHFLAVGASTPVFTDEDRPAGIALSARAWYLRHRLSVHACEIQQAVSDGVGD